MSTPSSAVRPTAAAGPTLAACSAVAAPAIATKTTGVAIPSLSPLSMLSSRRIRAGTAGFTITPAPRAASVGARSGAHQQGEPDTHPAEQRERQQDPQANSQWQPDPQQPKAQAHSARRSRSLTRDASENSTRTRVISARAFTSSWEGAKPSGASGAVGQQQAGEHEDDRRGHVVALQPRGQRSPHENNRRHESPHRKRSSVLLGVRLFLRGSPVREINPEASQRTEEIMGASRGTALRECRVAARHRGYLA